VKRPKRRGLELQTFKSKERKEKEKNNKI